MKKTLLAVCAIVALGTVANAGIPQLDSMPSGAIHHIYLDFEGDQNLTYFRLKHGPTQVFYDFYHPAGGVPEFGPNTPAYSSFITSVAIQESMIEKVHAMVSDRLSPFRVNVTTRRYWLNTQPNKTIRVIIDDNCDHWREGSSTGTIRPDLSTDAVARAGAAAYGGEWEGLSLSYNKDWFHHNATTSNPASPYCFAWINGLWWTSIKENGGSSDAHDILGTATDTTFYQASFRIAKTICHEIGHIVGGNDHLTADVISPIGTFFKGQFPPAAVRSSWASSGPVGPPWPYPNNPGQSLAERNYTSLAVNLQVKWNLEPQTEGAAHDLGAYSIPGSPNGTTYQGIIHNEDDQDWFKFKVNNSGNAKVSVLPKLWTEGWTYGPGGTAWYHSTDTKITIKEQGGGQIGSSDPTGEYLQGWRPEVVFSATAGKTYLIKVEPSGANIHTRLGNIGQYSLSLHVY